MPLNSKQMKQCVVIILLSVSMIACTSKKQRNNNTEQHQHSQEEINLNNGSKWKVAENMVIYIQNIEKSIHNFETSEHKDYNDLANSIDTNLNKLTSNCTMTGKAHDELHKWLVPFIELSEKLNNASDIKEQEEIYHQLKTSFVTYNTYFE